MHHSVYIGYGEELWNFRTHKFSFLGTNVPWVKLSFHRTFTLTWNTSSWSPGSRKSWNCRSLIFIMII